MIISNRRWNDIIKATDSGIDSESDIVGDAWSMSGYAKGGNDTITATTSGPGSFAVLFGDAQTCLATSRAATILSMAVAATRFCSATLSSIHHPPPARSLAAKTC